ncbi:kinase-like domain-containing protein, partial [Gautieria morchelliformis]
MRSSTATTKFTGTLTNREAIGKWEAGIMAFAHWVLQNTAGKFLFVDLQGMKCTITERDGDGILMLFDPMSHSYTQTSCAGDHGPKGIYAFLGSHICTTVCKAMKLISL